MSKIQQPIEHELIEFYSCCKYSIPSKADGLFTNSNLPALGAEAAAVNGRLFSRARGTDDGGTLLGHNLPEKKVDCFRWDREFSFHVQSRHSQRLLLGSWDSSIKVYGKVRP